MARVLATVGMPGAGKSEATSFFEKKGYVRVYFGGITIEELKKRRMPVNENNERTMREQLRKEHGMDAYAKLSIPRIDSALKKSDVIIDGLYSYEEYLLLKEKYKNKLIVINIFASPSTRYKRLAKRKIRPLTGKDCEERDRAQLENLHTGGPIAMADYTVINEGTLSDFSKALEKIA